MSPLKLDVKLVLVYLYALGARRSIASTGFSKSSVIKELLGWTQLPGTSHPQPLSSIVGLLGVWRDLGVHASWGV